MPTRVIPSASAVRWASPKRRSPPIATASARFPTARSSPGSPPSCDLVTRRVTPVGCLSSGGDRLLIWGDIVHLPSVQVPRPDAWADYDVIPELARSTRAEVFDWISREDLTVAGAHLPYPGFARIERRGDGYAYIPEP